MHTLPTSPTVAVIGAGPSGLATARRLIEAGFKVTVFERNSGSGGTWRYDPRSPEKIRIPTSHLHDTNLHGTASLGAKAPKAAVINGASRIPWYLGACYHSLMTNVKTPLMSFDTFEYPEHTPWFVPHNTILRYLEGFSDYAGVNGVMRYNTNVARIEEAGSGRWKLFTTGVPHNDPGQHACYCSLEEVFDKVVVCTGHFDSPYVPPIPGLREWCSEWPESIIHSKEYRNNDSFRGKSVLLVGAGSSAYDIGREISLVANKVYQIVRQKSWGAWSQAVNSIVPENMISMPEIALFGGNEGTHDMKDGHVILKDGSSVTGLDMIVFCTGYRFSLPFLPDYQAQEREGKMTVDRRTLITDGVKLHNLYQDMLFIPQPSLAFVGVPFATFPFLELQANTIAAVFSDETTLPNEETMYAEYVDRASKYESGELYTQGVDGEVQYVRETQSWSGGPSQLLKVSKYEQVLKEAERVFPDALARYLRSSRILQGRSAEEVERVIKSKVEEFKLAVARTS